MMLNFIKRLFGTKKELGYNIIVDYTDSAKVFMVGGSSNKRIFHRWGHRIISSETYNEVKKEEYINQGIPFFDRTEGTSVAKESLNTPMTEQALEFIELQKRLGE